MTIFPLRADFGDFFPASMQAEMASEMPTRLCEKGEHKMQKKQNPRLVWVGWQMGSKTPLEIQPWSCQILPDKATSQCFPHIPRSSFPAFLHSAFPNSSKPSEPSRFHRHRFIFSWMSKNPMSWSKRRCWMYLLLPASWFSLKTHFNKCIATPQVSLPASFPAPQSLLTLLKNSPAGSHLWDAILRDRFLLFPPTPVLKVEFLA